jgi:hypothetical protein
LAGVREGEDWGEIRNKHTLKTYRTTAMRYNINIDQRFCLEWGLNFAEGAVFGILYNLSSWADPVVVDGQIFYHASRNKVMDELPMLTDKPDTVYRIFKHLADENRALIQYEKDGRKDLIRLTDRGKKWNSEKNPSLADNSENIPNELGKKSENNSEKNPTDKNTNIITTTSININTLSQENAEQISNFQPQQIWGDNHETRFEKAQAALKAYFESSPGRWAEIANEARNEIQEADFHAEITLWLRRNSDDFQITQNPVKALTSGRSNFISWLAQPRCRDQYKQHGNDTQTSRNGRVQQQRPVNSFPSSEELKRKYGVL